MPAASPDGCSRPSRRRAAARGCAAGARRPARGGGGSPCGGPGPTRRSASRRPVGRAGAPPRAPIPPMPSRPPASTARVSSRRRPPASRIGAVVERQHRQVAEHRGRRGVAAERQVERRPGDQGDGERPRTPVRSRRPAADRRSAEHRDREQRAEGGERADPLDRPTPGSDERRSCRRGAEHRAGITAIRSCDSAAGRSAVRRETGASSV